MDNGERPYVPFFCLSWFQKKKKEVSQPVYDDGLKDDEEEDVPDLVPVLLLGVLNLFVYKINSMMWSFFRVQHEKIELTTLASDLPFSLGHVARASQSIESGRLLRQPITESHQDVWRCREPYLQA